MHANCGYEDKFREENSRRQSLSLSKQLQEAEENEGDEDREDLEELSFKGHAFTIKVGLS